MKFDDARKQAAQLTDAMARILKGLMADEPQVPEIVTFIHHAQYELGHLLHETMQRMPLRQEDIDAFIEHNLPPCLAPWVARGDVKLHPGTDGFLLMEFPCKANALRSYRFFWRAGVPFRMERVHKIEDSVNYFPGDAFDGDFRIIDLLQWLEYFDPNNE